ncbi:MAG: Choline-sulfatase [Pseudomonadota bacterium]
MILLPLLLACADPPPPTRPNILLISLDTVRADHTSLGRTDRDTTPTLRGLAAGGTTFSRAFSQSNESAYSHGALFTGRYATELAVPAYETYALPGTADLASEVLRAHGYATAMFSAGGHVDAAFGFDQGWDHFSAESGFGSLFDTAPKAEAWIGQQPVGPAAAPWFVFLHAYDAHRPYVRRGPWDHAFNATLGSPLAELLASSPCVSEMVIRDKLHPDVIPTWFAHTGGAQILSLSTYDRLQEAAPTGRSITVPAADVAHVKDHYDGGLLYVDTLLGATLARLQAAGALDNTVVLVVSDHGEDLLDHGFMNHRTGLTDSTTRVPMVAWGPGFSGGGPKVVDGLVEARDVAATLFAIAEARPPVGSGGRDLRALAAGAAPPLDAVFIEGVMDQLSVRTGTHRLTVSEIDLKGDVPAALRALKPGDPRLTLYDLVADPAEQVDRSAAEPAQTARLLTALIDWRAGLTTGTHALAQGEVPDAVAAELRAHGYWGAAPAAPTPGAADAAAAAAPAPTTPPKDHCQDRFALERLVPR